MPSRVRMLGSSIAAPSSAVWVTDFLAAAYYARPGAPVADLRLAHGVLASWWWRHERRVGLRDLVAFHRAFGRRRFARAPREFARLDRERLLAGAGDLLGDWFPQAWDDPERRAYGVAFPGVAERAAFVPEQRLESAALDRLTPPRRHDHWHTYPPVPLPSAAGALALLREPARWPDFASALGRFTPLRSGGLPGQTFEIELALPSVPRAPAWLRGYVTAVGVHEGAAADAYARALPPAVALPPGARGVAAIELVTHRAHFLGRGTSRLLVYEHDDRAWIRDVGSWDRMPPDIALAYRVAGARAQHRFWTAEDPDASMLAQLALSAA